MAGRACGACPGSNPTVRVSAVQRILTVLAALFGSLLVGSSAAATTTAEAATFTYDVQTNGRVADHECEAVAASMAQLNRPPEQSASRSVEGRGTSTTHTRGERPT
jgi:hypothetical protein